MSEVDKHYGAFDEDGPARRSPPRSGIPGARPGNVISSATDQAVRALGDARHTLGEAYETAADWAGESYAEAARRVRYARRRSEIEMGRSRQSVEAFVEDNPIMVGVAGLALGLLAGALLPGTRREDRYLGPYADDVKAQGLRYAQDLAEQGRNAVEENLRQVQARAKAAREEG